MSIFRLTRYRQDLILLSSQVRGYDYIFCDESGISQAVFNVCPSVRPDSQRDLQCLRFIKSKLNWFWPWSSSVYRLFNRESVIIKN